MAPRTIRASWLSVNGANLEARRNTGGLNSAKSIVYAERRSYEDVALS